MQHWERVGCRKGRTAGQMFERKIDVPYDPFNAILALIQHSDEWIILLLQFARSIAGPAIALRETHEGG